MVLLIALLHAVPVLLTAWIARRANPVWIAGGLMALIGVSTGAAKFGGMDLLAIGVAVWLGLKLCSPRSAMPSPASVTAAALFLPARPSRAVAIGKYLVRLLAWIAFYALCVGGVAFALADVRYVPKHGLPFGSRIGVSFYVGLIVATNAWFAMPLALLLARVRFEGSRSREALFVILATMVAIAVGWLTVVLLKADWVR